MNNIRIAHFGDIHVHNEKYQDVYRIQFQKIYDKLKTQNIDIIVVVGDLFEEFINISNECKLLSADILTKFSEISPVIIVPGNHDIRKKNILRKNSVETIVEILNNPRITYFGNSGFFQDKNINDILWVNYSHLEKDIDPFNSTDIKIPTNINDKIKIGLFHDPINNSKTDVGNVFQSKTYKNVSYFDKCDYVLLADVHKQQFLRDNGSMAYCGSTIQQNHGETPDGSLHGYLLWNIRSQTDFDVESIGFDNDYTFITFEIGKNYNYNNINLDSKFITQHSSIKIKINDLPSNINYINDQKLREYCKNKWGINNIKIEKNAIITNIDGVETLNENIDISNQITQKNIFVEYLTLNGYDNSIIDEVLKIDKNIADRINIIDNIINITWGIDKFYVKNFKSYKEFEIDWVDKPTIYLLNGKNQQGKSTILDAIMYILFNKTLGTIKKESKGDNRFINNKLDVDFCEGGLILNVNGGEKYTLIRKTTRKWSKDKKSISSCSTTLDIYKGIEISDENKLTDEQRKDTEKLISSIVNDFDSFVNSTLVTADTLNTTLSMDRAVFIDSLTRDMGIDIFSYKEDEFKEYKKEETKNFINIDITSKELEIENNKHSIIALEESIFTINDDILLNENEKNILQDKKEITIKTLNKIDPDIQKIDVPLLESKIELDVEGIDANKRTIILLEPLKEEIKKYDSTKLDNKQLELDEYNKVITDLTKQKTDLKLENSVKQNKIDSISNDIISKIEAYKNSIIFQKKDIEKEIVEEKKNFVTHVNNYTSKLKDELNEIIVNKTEYKSKIDNLMNDGKKMKVLNEELEQSKVCPTCDRLLEKDSILAISHKIEHNKNEMQLIKDNITKLKPLYDSLSEKIDNVQNKLNLISNKDYSFDETLQSEYNKTKQKVEDLKNEILKKDEILNNIENTLSEELKTEIDILKIVILDTKKYIDINNTKIDNIDTDIKKQEENITICKEQLQSLKDEKIEIDKKKEKINTIPVIELNIEKAENKIKENKSLIKQRNDLNEKILENNQINEKINLIQIEIDTVNEKIKSLNVEKTKIVTNIVMLNDRNKNIENEIEQFAEQKKKEENLNIYGKCVHRDGLPSFLLKKSIGVINQELNNLLTLVDFTVYFDDELNLKMFNNGDVSNSISVISASGMERTFIACALKIALRKINNKSKPNLLIFDEITGKLDAESVGLFTELLEVIKKEVDKLIIIEHQNNINYDVLINVKKDKKGISSLEVIY